MGYFIDLNTISIDEYGKILENAYLVPSRIILKKNIKDNVRTLKYQGIKTVNDLQQALKTKDKIKDFSITTGLPFEYLTILIREVNSINPKPNKLKEFPGISKEIVRKLENDNIKNTFQLFDHIKTNERRKVFAEKFNIPMEQVLELTKLTDLSRIKWASPIFCRILYDMGYDTVDKIANTNYEDLYEKINTENQEKNYFKGNIGLNDMKIFIEAAKNVSLEIEN